MQQDEPLAAIAMHEYALEIIEWLASDECHELDGAGLIDGLGAKLSKAGMALHRIVFHLRALHPTVAGRAIAWAPGEPVAGSKCHATTSRTHASSAAREASARAAISASLDGLGKTCMDS